MTVVKVPLLDLQAQYAPIRAEILAAVTRVCDSQRFILGPEVEQFEIEMASRFGVEHGIGVSSGTDAILLALMALEVGAGDEVIVPTYSFFATAGCVARVGARPVFVDIDPDTFNVDPAAVAAAITSRTRAILPVHLFGQSADMAPLGSAAAKAGVPLVEDAAQAIDARYDGRPVGGFGAFGCFSFYPSKNLSAFGDAGLLAARDEALARRARLLRTHGASPKYHHRLIGGNFRLDALQAAVLRVKARHLASWTEARRRNARRYRDLFHEARLVPPLALPQEVPGRHHVYNQYVIRVPERDTVRDHLAACGVETEIYYPVPFHLQACFAGLDHQPGACPAAEAAAREALALPIYPELTEDQQAWVVRSIAELFEK